MVVPGPRLLVVGLMSTDLFGQPIADPRPPVTDEAPDRITNDIAEVVAVLGIASGDGYAVTGARHQVWRCAAEPLIEPVPRHEADTVRQLLGAGWLTVGGTHVYEHHRADVTARAVLVPKRVRQWLLRQTSYKPLAHAVTPTSEGGGRCGRTDCG